MKFTDLFIRRPVLATVVSLLILVLGLRSIASLPVLEFPRTENATVTITTSYPGAAPDVVAGFVTTPIENVVAQVNGIDYMTSSSLPSASTITVNLQLNYDPDKALTEISAKIQSVLNQLPTGVQQPQLKIQVGQTIDDMYIGFSSNVLPNNGLTDYITRVVQPRLQSVPGVQTAEILGGKNFALRAWLDPDKLAAYGLTASDVSTALAANDFISGVGNSKGQMVQINLAAATDLHTVDEFKNLVIKQTNNAIIRLSDVANVTLGSDDYESRVAFDGQNAVYIGIQIAPGANLLNVIGAVSDLFPSIQAQLPEGVQGRVVYDSTTFVRSSISEVIQTLAKAMLIVTVVVFLFLGSLRSVFIPVITIPLSLVGAFAVMLALGFSINLLTLLALVLAIGLVVDDAIIVVENVNRHLEDGMTPLQSALTAARELGGPIIAMTVVLISVYIPIGFQSGLTGALFTEFAFTLVGAVTISALVALTLSPMLSSRLLRAHKTNADGKATGFVGLIDRVFEKLRNGYRSALTGTLRVLPGMLILTAIVLVSIYFLFTGAKQELAPDEDQGFMVSIVTNAATATLKQRTMYSQQVYNLLHSYPEADHVFQFDLPGQAFAGMVLKPWDQRARSTQTLQPIVQNAFNSVAGAQAFIFSPPSLPGPFGPPIDFVIKSTNSFDRMNTVAQAYFADVMKSGNFIFMQDDLKVDEPQSTLVIDRDKAAQLGMTMSDVGGAMAWMLGGGNVNYFSLDGRSYKVIPQVEQQFRLNPSQILNYYLKTPSGGSVPVSTIASIQNSVVPESINHFQQANSVTFQGAPFPGVSQGDALKSLQDIAAKDLPQGYSVDYAASSREFEQESSGFVAVFGFALIIIFLALAALFESFRDPIIILISVPMAISGALIFISMGIPAGLSLNIYTEVGLVTLMGLISKHGILMVEFANSLQKNGRGKREAIIEAASIRLRPILMTTAAMVLGVIPLILASGAGAASRFQMGMVIASGLSIGTLFTLFVVPSAYALIAHDLSKTAHETEPKPDADAAGASAH